MRVTALEVTKTTAIVELRPSWLARLLGARIVVVELVASRRPTHLQDHWSNWVTGGVGRRLDLDDAADFRILNALDFRPPAQLPRATVTRCAHGYEVPRREGHLSCLRCST